MPFLHERIGSSAPRRPRLLTPTQAQMRARPVQGPRRIDRGVERERLVLRERWIEVGLLGDVPGARERARRLARDRPAEHRDRSVQRPQQAEQQADRRGLARAVGPEEPIHRAGGYAEGEIADLERFAGTVVQVPDLDGAAHATFTSSSRSIAWTKSL